MAGVVVAASAWAASLAPVELALLQLGGSTLLSAASRALMPEPNSGVRGHQVSAPEAVASRQIVYGRQRKGGTVVYLDVRGEKNQILDMIIVVASHEVESIGNIYFEDELAIPAGQTTAIGRYVDRAFAGRAMGSPNQTAFAGLQAAAGGKWTAQHRLRGCAAIWVNLHFDPDVYPRGIPNVTVVIDGKNDIYDPRTDARGYSQNAALCTADYLSLPEFGLGAAVGAADGVNTAALIEAANVCDEIVPKPGGGTERRYDANGTISLDQTPKAVIESLLTASAGTCVWQSGQWHLFAGAYRPPLIEIDVDDVAAGSIRLTTRRSMAENFNCVRGQFVAPENDWQPDDFPPYESAAYIAEDGGEKRWTDLALPFTISPYAAQRIARITLERARRQFMVTGAFQLSMWRLAVGDTVNLTRTRWGFAAKPFEVSGMVMGVGGGGASDAALTIDLTLSETSPLVYDWDVTEAQIYEAAPRTTLPSATDAAPPRAVEVSEQQYVTRAGDGVKTRAHLLWQEALSGFVAQYQVESSMDGINWQVHGRTTELTFDIDDIGPGSWMFGVRSITGLGVTSERVTVVAEIYGLSAPPVALTGITLQTAGGSAILKWAQSADLDVRIGGSVVIRHTIASVPSWSNSVSMDVVPGAAAIAVVPFKPGTYLLAARDSEGVVGPAIQVSTDGVQVIGFAPVANLVENPSFLGTKTDVVASGGLLQLGGSSSMDSWADFDAVADVDWEGGVLPSGTYLFSAGIDLGSLRRVRLRSVIDMSIQSLSSTIDARPWNIDDWDDFDGPLGGECDVVVECRTTQTNPGGSPTWSDWSRVESTEVQAWGVQARAILTTTDAAYSPLVSKLEIHADEVA